MASPSESRMPEIGSRRRLVDLREATPFSSAGAFLCGTIQLLFPFRLFCFFLFPPFPAVAWPDFPSAFRGLACLLRGRVFSSRRGVNLQSIPAFHPPSRHTGSPASHSRLACWTQQVEWLCRALSLPVQHLHLTTLPIVRFSIRWLGTPAR